jgi:ankyrin repeat protein
VDAACANGHAECAKELIANGAKHVANASGNTPLRTVLLSLFVIVAKPTGRADTAALHALQTGLCRTSTC